MSDFQHSSFDIKIITSSIACVSCHLSVTFDDYKSSSWDHMYIPYISYFYDRKVNRLFENKTLA
jgi:hypothetical protein